MKIDIDALLANMPKEEVELKKVQAKHRLILQENRDEAKSRKQRTHRLCQHGAIMESYFPETIEMDEARFAGFMRELVETRDLRDAG